MCSDAAPRLSVLIPCYGTASLVGRCLESLVPLADHDVEILMVDDCSPDGVGEAITRALDTVAAPLAPHIRVLRNTRNLGLAGSRERLFTEARGRYMATVDSDDYVDARAMLRALDVAEKDDADIVAAPYYIATGEKVTRNNVPEKYELNRLPIHVNSFALWNKLIKRTLLIDNDLHWYQGLNRWEDVGMTARLYALRPKIVTVNDAWYYYCVDPARPTLSTFAREATIRERSEITRSVEKWLKNRGLDKEYAEFITALKFYAKSGYLRRPVDLKSWRATFPEARATLSTPSALPLHYRLLFRLLSVL